MVSRKKKIFFANYLRHSSRLVFYSLFGVVVHNCIKYVSSVNALEKIIVIQDDEIFDHFFLNEILVTYEIQSALLDTR